MACFVVPALQFIRIEVIGVISGSDIALIVLFIYVVLFKKIQIATREGKRFLVLCSAWLAGQILTDIVRHSEFADLARGWSNIGLTILNFCALFPLLYRNRRRLEFFGWGMVVGRIIAAAFNPDGLMLQDPWKFGYSFPVTWAIYLIASRKECRGHLPILLSVFAGVLNMLLGHRSLGGFCLSATTYLIIAHLMHTPGAAKMKKASKIASVSLLIVGAVGIFWLYGHAADAGLLGEEAQSKYAQQSTGKYGVLLGGRTESLAYLPAIYDSPILGHGSWAKDPIYIMMEIRALALLGYTSSENLPIDYYRSGVIPTHSFLFGAWVEAGILGAVFWVWLFVLAIRLLFQDHSQAAPLKPLFSFMACQLVWDILFSPYGGENRLVVAYYVLVLLSCIKAVRLKRIPLPSKHLNTQIACAADDPQIA